DGVDGLELEDDDPGRPFAFEDLELTAPDQEAAAVAGDAGLRQLAVGGVLLLVRDLELHDDVGAHAPVSFLRRTCKGRPGAPMAASARASERVGWGAMVRATSSTVAAISTARAASAASSATPAPTMWTPRTVPSARSATISTEPSGRPSASARPEADSGNRKL